MFFGVNPTYQYGVLPYFIIWLYRYGFFMLNSSSDWPCMHMCMSCLIMSVFLRNYLGTVLFAVFNKT